MNVLDILNSPWAIEPGKLNEICAIYAAHRNGETLDLAEFQKSLEAKANSAVALAGNGASGKNYQVQDGIALIPIEGILSKRMSLFQTICGGTSYTSLQEKLVQALADPGVSAIILTIDSPGGAVDGVQAAAEAIFAARSVKPTYAYIDGKAASAAYWLGSAASQLYIGSDVDQVGSIGVITQHVDTSNAEHQRGVKITDIAAGRYKTVGSQHAPLSAEDRTTIQDHLDHIYGIFVDSVARNRGTDVKTVLAKMADGRIFVGQKAIDAGLVDGKTTLTQLMQKIRSKSGNAGSTVRSSAPSRNYTPRKPDAIAASADQPPVTAASKAEPGASAEATLETTVSVMTAAEFNAMQKIAKLRVLKQEEAATRRLLKGAEATEKTAKAALFQATNKRGSWQDLVPFTTASINAEQTVRSLRERLRANDWEQLQVLRG